MPADNPGPRNDPGPRDAAGGGGAHLDLTIVIPAFNEEARLAEGLERLHGAVRAGAIDPERTEVILVDDGSTDGTAQVADELLAGYPHHLVHRVATNRGKGAAVRTGISLARSTLCAHMDADMAIDPISVSDLRLELRAHEVAIGSRALPGSMVDGRYVVRSLMGRLFNRMVTAGTRLRFADTQCGFKGFRTPVARLLFHLVEIDRFAFDVEVLARAAELGLGIAEIPVHWKNVPGSSIHPLHDAVTMVADVARVRLDPGRRPTVTSLWLPGTTGTTGTTGRGENIDDTLAALAEIVTSRTGRAPLPVVRTPSGGAGVLLALVDPVVAAAVTADARRHLGSAGLQVRRVRAADLARSGPLSGRIDAITDIA
ncbi:MAG: glycosyltransferase [Actinomycetota bacterium]|nr:glycosyltransferase [Actinomycetota bacterium]